MRGEVEDKQRERGRELDLEQRNYQDTIEDSESKNCRNKRKK